MLERTC